MSDGSVIIMSNEILKTVDAKELLPSGWESEILEVVAENNVTRIKLLVDAKTVDEVKQWINDYEQMHNVTYSIRSSEKAKGCKVLYKVRFQCHHNTKCDRVYSSTSRNRTKNLNCPSALAVTLYAEKTKRAYQGQKSFLINSNKRCEIILIPTHNHNIDSAETLKFKRVSADTTSTLLELFKNGHTPASALKLIKTDIELNNENPDILLSDRSVCPDYMYCYHLYMKEFVTKCGPVKMCKKYLKGRVEKFNKLNINSALFEFENEEYVICICTPLMRRVHKYADMAKEVVFMDSIGSLDIDRCRIYTLFTYTECGSLPMGLFITSSDSSSLISKGFHLLKKLVGHDIFGGNINGPEIFITEDSEAELAAIRNCWTNSESLLCSFHVLQSTWKWLMKEGNKIPAEKRSSLYEQFRQIMYAKNNEEAEKCYQIALQDGAICANYFVYLKTYWQRRSMWVLCYRSDKARGQHINGISYSVMRLQNDKIFEKTKALNLVQLLDYSYSEFTGYYVRRLMAVAHNRTRQNVFRKKSNIDKKIKKLKNETYAAPSRTADHLMYLVDMEILSCTCDLGRSGKICEHVEWICRIYDSQEYSELMNVDDIKRKCYFLATGNNSTAEFLQPQEQNHDRDFDNFTQCTIEYEENINDSCQSNSPPAAVLNMSEESLDTSLDSIMKEADGLLENITVKFKHFLSKSPNEVKCALEMLDSNLANIKTVSEFTSSCAAFGKSDIHLQSTSVERRKIKIENRRNVSGGRPTKIRKVLEK